MLYQLSYIPKVLERPVGIEPTIAGWKPTALPLGYGRIST